MSKERELLEAFAKKWNKPGKVNNISSEDIDLFLAGRPEREEENNAIYDNGKIIGYYPKSEPKTKDLFTDTEADGFVFCGKCGKPKEI